MKIQKTSANANSVSVAPTGKRLYRRLVIGKAHAMPGLGRLPVGDTAACQPALRRRAIQGIMLMECLVYISVLAVIFALGYGAYFRAFDSSKALQRNANDITRALNAGEHWREDVRLAKSISLTNNVLKIIQPGARVEYAFEDGSVWRTSGGNPRTRVLADVKESRMSRDQRQLVSAWRWELELQTRKAAPKLKPLFSFQAATVTTP